MHPRSATASSASCDGRVARCLGGRQAVRRRLPSPSTRSGHQRGRRLNPGGRDPTLGRAGRRMNRLHFLRGDTAGKGAGGLAGPSARGNHVGRFGFVRAARHGNRRPVGQLGTHRLPICESTETAPGSSSLSMSTRRFDSEATATLSLARGPVQSPHAIGGAETPQRSFLECPTPPRDHRLLRARVNGSFSGGRDRNRDVGSMGLLRRCRLTGPFGHGGPTDNAPPRRGFCFGRAAPPVATGSGVRSARSRGGSRNGGGGSTRRRAGSGRRGRGASGLPRCPALSA